MSILLFLIVFALTIFLQQWLHRHIQTFALTLTGNPGCAIRLLFYLLLPGILLHEASHYLTAKLLLVPTNGITVGIGRAMRNQVSFGSVHVERADIVRASLIGAAPFVVGTGAILLIAGWGFGLWAGSPNPFVQMLLRLRDYSNDLTTWLEVYLIFVVSTAMIPSESDREPWGPLITIFGSGVAILFLLGWTPRVSQNLVLLARQILDALTFALGLAVIVNGTVAIVLWTLEGTVKLISGRRVD